MSRRQLFSSTTTSQITFHEHVSHVELVVLLLVRQRGDGGDGSVCLVVANWSTEGRVRRKQRVKRGGGEAGAPGMDGWTKERGGKAKGGTAAREVESELARLSECTLIVLLHIGLGRQSQRAHRLKHCFLQLHGRVNAVHSDGSRVLHETD